MTVHFELRECCIGLPGETSPRAGLLFRSEGSPVERLGGTDGATVAVEPPRVWDTLPTRLHEAGHGVVAHAVGARVRMVSVWAQPLCGHASPPTKAAGVAITVAGDVAMRWCDGRRVHRPDDGELKPYFARVAAGCGGTCDGCFIARDLQHRADPLTDYRLIEAAVISFVRRPRVARAIRDLADALLIDPMAGTADVERVIAPHVAFGELLDHLPAID